MQAFRQAEYFHGRPSDVDYDAASSGGTNLAPTNRELVDAVDERVGVIAEETGRPDVCGTHKRLARDPQAGGVGGSGAVGRLCKPVSMPESRPALIISHIADKPFIGFGQSQLERGLRAPTHRHESFAR
ncbi:potassium-transporting ATPase subunit C [Sinorhizobium fredii]|uniref:potassium-transporting ATPase subunit C n=1 Tax=Rhizobium fredii TaxID=380 RepID=UPI0009B6F2C6